MARRSSAPEPPLSPVNKPSTQVLLANDLLESLPDAIIAVDHTGRIVQVNTQAQELFGYERDELVGEKVEMLVPESYRREHQHHRKSFAESPKTRRMGAGFELYGRRRKRSIRRRDRTQADFHREIASRLS